MSRTFQDVFADPYDINTSFQLSDRLKGTDKLNLIDRVKEADQALQTGDYRTCLRLVRDVTSFLDASQRSQIVNRIIYNHLYLKSFEPAIIALPPKTREGRFSVGVTPSMHRDLDISITDLTRTLVTNSRKYFHDLYGADVSRSMLGIRHSRMVGLKNGSSAGVSTGDPSHPMFRDTNSNFLHLDEKKGITTIVYLADVSEASGGFRYVKGSHGARMSPILKAFHEFIYNDLRLETDDEVKGFPPEFRAGINYYHWLGPEKRGAIDAFTTTLTGPAGTAISFAGNRLLHGGGIPYSGERTALFIGHVGYVSQRMRQLIHPLALLHRLGYGN